MLWPALVLLVALLESPSPVGSLKLPDRVKNADFPLKPNDWGKTLIELVKFQKKLVKEIKNQGKTIKKLEKQLKKRKRIVPWHGPMPPPPPPPHHRHFYRQQKT